MVVTWAVWLSRGLCGCHVGSVWLSCGLCACHVGSVWLSRGQCVVVTWSVRLAGVRRRMWKLVEVLLIEAGVDIWLCLLAPFHTCHKYVYR